MTKEIIDIRVKKFEKELLEYIDNSDKTIKRRIFELNDKFNSGKIDKQEYNRCVELIMKMCDTTIRLMETIK